MIDNNEGMQKTLATNWLLNMGITTPEYLDEVRYRLAVMFKCIKNIEVECNIKSKEVKLGIKLRWFRGMFVSQKKLEKKILINLIELLPDYTVSVTWI